MTFRQGSRITAALLGAVLLFGGTAAAQISGSVTVRAPFVNGDCVKSSGPSAVSTTGSPCGTGTGTVTSVNASGGTTGLSFSGGPITTSGTLTLAGGLVVSNGGTGALTFTANGVIYGNTTSALGVTAAGTTGQYLKATTAAAPSWGTLATDAVTTLSFGSTGLTPNSATSGAISVAGTLVVGNGGSGAATFTANGLLYGNTTSAFGVTAAGTTGQYLKGNTGSAPTFGTLASDAVSSISFGTTGLTPNIATAGVVSVAGTLGFANGGTSNSSYTDGQLLIGNSGTGGLTKASLTAGTNITITPGAGSITIAASGGGGGCATAGSSTQVLTDNGAGGCTSNAAFLYSAGTATLGTAGSVVGSVALKNATSGTLTLSPPTGALGTVTVTVPAATDTLVNLASSQTLTNKTITTFGGALTFNPANANFTLSPTGTGTGAIAPATAGTINNMSVGVTTALAGNFTSIGATTRGTGAFTTLDANSTVTLSPANVAVTISPSGTGTVAISPVGALTINPTAASTINNASIGVTTPLAVKTTGLTLNSTTSTITLNASVGTSGQVLTSAGAGATPTWTTPSGASSPSTQTTDFSPAAGGLYCVDTTSGAITATLPASPANGDTITFLDCKQRFATANLILGRNALTIMNSATDLTVNTNNANFRVVYVSNGGVTTWMIY